MHRTCRNQVGQHVLTMFGFDRPQLCSRTTVDGDDHPLATASAAHLSSQIGSEFTDTHHVYASVHSPNGRRPRGQGSMAA